MIVRQLDEGGFAYVFLVKEAVTDSGGGVSKKFKDPSHISEDGTIFTIFQFPSVQELAKQPITKIPHRYVRQYHQNPLLKSSDGTSIPSVPVIDLHKLFTADSGSSTFSSELSKLHTASKEWGFYQVINHGISEPLLEDFKREVLNFFKLPMEEKQKLWQEEENHEGFGQLFVVSEEKKLDWSDMFYITTLPHNLRQSQLFQKLPPIIRLFLLSPYNI